MNQKENQLFWYSRKAFGCFLLFFYCGLPVKAQQDSSKRFRQEPPTNVKWVVPAAITVSGVLAAADISWIDRKGIRNWRNRNFSGFHTKADDVLSFTPAAAVYIMDWAGIKARTDFANRTSILLKSELVMMAVVYPLKYLTHVQRPDSSNFHSFPSGHTAQAFLAANFFRHEYGGRSVWYSIGAYTLASGVGLMRILNNKHWASDVLAGAGIGILSSELAYHTHQYKWGKKWNKVTALPWMGSGQAGLYVRVGL